eukprot:TRINITY_DN2080_c0_g1_i1.p1 TRINITY_DN2080_c0_g1~~TRINITY_DN2080_c0_g1_i1.p1  ORF type:complete len:1229 (-),score=422.42 TRINITY_DN2080_c0_g1_i1:80-3766(-)
MFAAARDLFALSTVLRSRNLFDRVSSPSHPTLASSLRLAQLSDRLLLSSTFGTVRSPLGSTLLFRSPSSFSSKHFSNYTLDMEQIPDKFSFPGTEKEIGALWDKLDAFQTSVKRSEGKPEYTFYDGPPFATGLPHYGHILAGTIKDTVTRYAHQTGHHVIRRFGWDCHGLPIEFEIDKELGVKTRDDVLKMGIPKYNAACRAIVMRYSSEWERVVKRLGRWIDFKNDYKTLDLSFMESVWWVFKQIHEKGLVYRGFKVMPYSTACTTPLSNFEANLAYKDVDDPAVSVTFPLEDEPEVSLVAWTTTPWTLPSNLAVCVHPDFDYVRVFDKANKKEYILLEKRLSEIFPKIPADKKDFNVENNDFYEVKKRYKGKDLKGKRYTPLFDYFKGESGKGAFQVLADTYVTDDSGTGIVHCAPAFGEDDYRVCQAANIITKGEDIVCPVDANGNFTEEVPDFKGVHVKAADKDIIKLLKKNNRLVHSGTLRHPYPFCWRSDTPLIYKAVPSWFIKVEDVKQDLIENNKQSYWVPEYVQERRFANWLADARDWAVSRNRYWGTPIPIWTSEDGKEILVIGSVAELEKYSGVKVTDLHRESIDHITIPSQRGPEFGNLKRVEEVFDCWFESGSMPYAQNHYPFENEKLFETGFPADFIAEGIDQTRGWFYTLLVISTILFKKTPYKNLVVNGMVLAADGKKMSKRLKNYPDPMEVVEEFGADALRLYLINSPVVRGESLKFQKEGVKNVLKDVFLPWFNAFRFFAESLVKFNLGKGVVEFKPDTKLALSSTNVMDKWILAATNGLIQFVRQEMQAYRLYTVTPRLVQFIEQLTNWYVRLNRRRLKGVEGEEDSRKALAVMYEVLYTVTRAMAPFTPYLTEYFYQHLRKIIPESEREDSVHYLMFPVENAEALNPRIVEAVGRMQAVILLGRQARERKNLPLKLPLGKITVIHKDPQYLKDVEGLKNYVQGELNVKEVICSANDTSVVTTAKPDLKALGTKLKKDMGKVQAEIKNLTHEQIGKLQTEGKIELAGHVITAEELLITREYKGDTSANEPAWDADVLIILDLKVDEKMQAEGTAREIINRIQKLRKKAGIVPTDPIQVFYEAKGDLEKVMSLQKDFVRNNIGVPLSHLSNKPASAVQILSEDSDINGAKLNVVLARLEFALGAGARAKSADDAYFNDLKTLVHSKEYYKLLKDLQTNGKVAFNLNGKNIELVYGQDIFASEEEKLASGK